MKIITAIVSISGAGLVLIGIGEVIAFHAITNTLILGGILLIGSSLIVIEEKLDRTSKVVHQIINRLAKNNND